MLANLLPLAALLIVGFAGCLDGPPTPAETPEYAHAKATLTRAAQEHEAEQAPQGKDYRVDESGQAPFEGIDQTFTWAVDAANFTAFEVSIRIQGVKETPCQSPPSVSYELKGGTEGSSIRRAGSQGGGSNIGLGLTCSNGQTVLRYAPAAGRAPLGDYSLKVKIGEKGLADWNVTVFLDYA